MPVTAREFALLPPLVQRVLGSRFALPSPDFRTFVPAVPGARNRGALGALPGNTGIVPPHLRNRPKDEPVVVRLPTHKGQMPMKAPGQVRRIFWHEFDPTSRRFIIRFVDRLQSSPQLAGLAPQPSRLPRRVQQTSQLQGLSLSKALKWVGNNAGTVLGAAALVGGAYWAQDAAGGWSQLLTSDGWSKVGDAITGGGETVQAVTIDPGAYDHLPGGTYLDPSTYDLAIQGPGVVSDVTGAASALDWSNVFNTGPDGTPLQTLQDASLRLDGSYLGPAFAQDGGGAGHSIGGDLAAGQGSGTDWTAALNSGLGIAGKALSIAGAFSSGEAAPPNNYNRAMAATGGAKGPSQLAAQTTAGKKLQGVDPRTGELVYSDGSRVKAPAGAAPASIPGAAMVGSPSGLPSWALPVGLLVGVVALGLAASGGSKG